jgi:hypothetical protein
VLHQNFGGLTHGFFWSDCAIGPDFENELIVIGFLPHARALNIIVGASDRAKNGVYWQFTNWQASAFFGRENPDPIAPLVQSQAELI